jgi:hypothetical protein
MSRSPYSLVTLRQDLENWGIFEPFSIRPKDSNEIHDDDESLLKAPKAHGVEFIGILGPPAAEFEDISNL